MKIILSLIVIVLFSSIIFSHTEQEKETRLSAKELNKRIIKRVFSDVPQAVRDYHGKGTLRLYVKVNQDGIVKSANIISGFYSKLNEYVENTVLDWKFKPLVVHKTAVSFKGVIKIPFCYGAFGDCY